MTIVVLDNFVGPLGDDLSAHAPDIDRVGGGWLEDPANGFELDGAGAAKNALSNDAVAIDSGTFDMRVGDLYNAGGVDNRFSIVARSDGVLLSTSRTGYELNIRPGDTGGAWTLYKVVAGTATALDAGSFAWALGDSYLCEIEAIKTSIKGFIGGIQITSIVNGDIAAGTYAGLRGALRTDASARHHYFSVDDTASPKWGHVRDATREAAKSLFKDER